MLTRRIIPCLDVNQGRVVKGVTFTSLRDAGDPVELAALYNREGADELVFYDITASAEGRAIILDVVSRTAEAVFIPLTVGGGVRSADDVQRMLRAGADKVSLNTAAVERPEVIRESADWFGSQCIVLSMDVKWNGRFYEIVTHGGRRPTGLDAIESEAVPVPVVASGGAGTPEHMARVLTEAKADAALAASIFHYGALRIADVKSYLQARGVPVRIPEPVGASPA